MLVTEKEDTFVTNTSQLIGILEDSEIEALNDRKRLTFQLSNLSFHPSERQQNLARELGQYIPDAWTHWHHVPVNGTFALYTLSGELQGEVNISRIRKEDLRDEVSKYTGSAIRPASMEKPRLYITQVLPREVNISTKMPQVWKPGVSIYAREDNFHKDEFQVHWSAHCLRESKID